MYFALILTLALLTEAFVAYACFLGMGVLGLVLFFLWIVMTIAFKVAYATRLKTRVEKNNA